MLQDESATQIRAGSDFRSLGRVDNSRLDGRAQTSITREKVHAASGLGAVEQRVLDRRGACGELHAARDVAGAGDADGWADEVVLGAWCLLTIALERMTIREVVPFFLGGGGFVLKLSTLAFGILARAQQEERRQVTHRSCRSCRTR